MPESLPAFLKYRAARSFRYLVREIETVTTPEALRFARSDWPAHRFGIGQNGSIAGIVSHVAAWKQLTLPRLAQDSPLLPLDALNAETMPAPDDWDGIRNWLQRIGTEWNATLDHLPDAAFDELRQWEPHPVLLAEYVAEIIEHDIQHAAQIEYLKQVLHTETP